MNTDKQIDELDCLLGICRHFTKEDEAICWYSQTYNKLRKSDPYNETDFEYQIGVKAKAKINHLIQESYKKGYVDGGIDVINDSAR